MEPARSDDDVEEDPMQTALIDGRTPLTVAYAEVERLRRNIARGRISQEQCLEGLEVIDHCVRQMETTLLTIERLLISRDEEQPWDKRVAGHSFLAQ
jgi:hypothetical protein